MKSGQESRTFKQVVRPRLLVILNRFVIGGQSTDTIPLLYQLSKRYHVKIIYGKKEADEIAPLFLLEQYPGLTMIEVPAMQRTLNPVTDVVAFRNIVKEIKAFKPDIVHTHGAKSGFLGRLAARMCKVPVVVHTFHGHVFHSYFNRIISKAVVNTERLMASVTDAAIALSTSQRNEIVNTFKVFPRMKVHVIPLGLEMKLAGSDARMNFRDGYGLPSHEVAVGIIGRIVAIKNHHHYLRIAKNLLDSGCNNCTFFIIGDGNLAAALQQYLDENGTLYSTPHKPSAGAKVIFTSWLYDMPTVVAGLDIIALTSLNEGTPVSLIEAQMGGKPVIAYDVGGVADTFLDNVSGYLVPKGDIETFTQKLSQLIGNPQLRQDMGEQGKVYCTQKFSKVSEVNATDNLYISLLAKRNLATV
ncbi:glycosyltransferase [Segetibacter sp. 3557_3]|uniref:glycosyltransferase n=1 Tax=Segetibacter sp. 3557_3 TaxID=2547429 RepID=UPI0014043B1B|nr:glycosyltransferase [Segetibacter sp. 3557_3]